MNFSLKLFFIFGSIPIYIVHLVNNPFRISNYSPLWAKTKSKKCHIHALSITSNKYCSFDVRKKLNAFIYCSKLRWVENFLFYPCLLNCQEITVQLMRAGSFICLTYLLTHTQYFFQ